jgi:hypothetical protein
LAEDDEVVISLTKLSSKRPDIFGSSREREKEKEIIEVRGKDREREREKEKQREMEEEKERLISLQRDKGAWDGFMYYI